MPKNLTADPTYNIKLIKSNADKVFGSGTVLANLCLTQAVHESNILRYPSKLAKTYNNLFGIKGKGLTGKSIKLPTWEVINGRTVYVKADFAWNDLLEDSIKQYQNLISKTRYQRVRECQNLDDAFIEIVKAGYATDPKYTNKLIEVWEQIQIILKN